MRYSSVIFDCRLNDIFQPMRCRKYAEQTKFIVLIPILFSGLKFNSNLINYFLSYFLVIISFLVCKRKIMCVRTRWFFLELTNISIAPLLRDKGN